MIKRGESEIVMSKVQEFTERAIDFLRSEDYNSLDAHREMEAICSEMNEWFFQNVDPDEARKEPRVILVPTFLSAIVSLDWNLWGDERVYELGDMLADILEHVNNDEVINVEMLSGEIMAVSKFIIACLSLVGKERMTTVGKAAYTSAVTAITFATAEIARVYC